MKIKTNKKLRLSARWQDCMIRLPGICNFDNSTTVLAHLNGGGMGMKKHDMFASFACCACHEKVDTDRKYELYHRQGVERTQQFWLENGYIEIK
jgi:hypothetical protein